MKNILILLSVITICHVSTGDDEDDEVVPWWVVTPVPQVISISALSSASSLPSASSLSASSQTSTTRKLYEEELIANCLRGCSVTKEYNPVCGTNNVTYDNPGRLECVQRCGVYVKLRKRGRCFFDTPKNLTRSSIVSCVKNCPIPENFLATCGTNNVTYANPERLECVVECGVVVSVDSYRPCYRYPSHEDSLTEIEFKVCHEVCSSNKELRPICGTDGHDYRNHEDLHCARKCGINVNIRSETKCSDHLFATTASLSTPGLEILKTIKPKRGMDINQVMTCMQQCPLTPECEPVCGSDGVTYRNPVRLLCSQYCGIDVKLQDFGYCTSSSRIFSNCQSKIDNDNKINPTATSTTPLKTHITTALPTKTPEKQCLLLCRVSRVYIPVCGSDGKMYDNIDHLICAKKCGVDVTVKKHTACKDFEIPSKITPEQFDIPVRAPTHSNLNEEKLSATMSSSASIDYGTASIDDNTNGIDDNTNSIDDYSTTGIDDNATSIDDNTLSTDYSTTSIDNNKTSIGYYSTTSLDNTATSIDYSTPSTYFTLVGVKNISLSTENSLFRTNNSPFTGIARSSPSTENSLIRTKKSLSTGIENSSAITENSSIRTKNNPSNSIQNSSVSTKKSTTGKVPITVQYLYSTTTKSVKQKKTIKDKKTIKEKKTNNKGKKNKNSALGSKLKKNKTKDPRKSSRTKIHSS